MPSSVEPSFAPPAGPPPGWHGSRAEHAEQQRAFAPPPGSPPQTFEPPPGPPPDASGPNYGDVPQSQHSGLPSATQSTEQVNPSEAPPPYTAKASDPLPSWAQSVDRDRLKDLSSSVLPLSPDHLPLDPPPAFFSTPTPLRIRAHSFQPFAIPSNTRNIADGFALLYTDELGAHGIAARDWARFLQDLGVAARLALRGLNMRGQRPRAGSAGGLLGMGSTRGRQYDSAFMKSPLEQVAGLVVVYNESAWERRKVRVTLRAKADERGREGYELLVEAL